MRPRAGAVRALLVLLLTAACAVGAAPQRLAWVVGQEAYPNARLRTVARDAQHFVEVIGVALRIGNEDVRERKLGLFLHEEFFCPCALGRKLGAFVDLLVVRADEGVENKRNGTALGEARCCCHVALTKTWHPHCVHSGWAFEQGLEITDG